MAGCRVIYVVLRHKSASAQHQTKLVCGLFQPLGWEHWVKAASLYSTRPGKSVWWVRIQSDLAITDPYNKVSVITKSVIARPGL